MKRTLFVVAALVAFATAASAATISVVSNKLTYGVGEQVILTVTGDSQGGKDDAVLGRLEYSAALTTTLTSSQSQFTRGGGVIFALTGSLAQGDGFADVINQIIDSGGTPRTVDNLQISTATLVADAAGTVAVSWATGVGFQLDFFGLDATSQPGTIASFTIIPEPTTAALLGLGLLGLVLGGRRRS
jgi:hypothetical protein